MFKLVLYCLAMTLWAQTSMACSCGRVAGAEELLAGSDAVFTGVVTATTARGGNAAETTFRVTEAFKGVSKGQSVLIRHRSGASASCGVNFEKGETYTLSAHSSDRGLETGMCSTWMFLPHIPSSARLIDEMRSLRKRMP